MQESSESLTELQRWLLLEGRQLLSNPERLSKAVLTPAQRVAISQQQQLRRRSRQRFPAPEKWLWSDRSLSQASDWLSACYKAELFPKDATIVDGCCGAGADSVALAEGRTVTAIDNDPWMVALAESNALAHGRKLQGVVAAFDAVSLKSARWLHIDPDRRKGGRFGDRKTLVDDEFSPRLVDILGLAATVSGALVKIAPSTELSECSLAALKHDWIRIWLGSRGECRQQILARGDEVLSRLHERIQNKRPSDTEGCLPKSIAVLLGDSENGSNIFDDAYYFSPATNTQQSGLILSPQIGPFLVDLNATLFAANLHRYWSLDHDLMAIESEFGYYSADRVIPTPWANFYEVLENLPWDDRKVRKWLRAHGAGPVEVKCRLVRFDASVYQRRLTQPYGRPVSLLVTRIGPKVRCFACRRIVHTKESYCP